MTKRELAQAVLDALEQDDRIGAELLCLDALDRGDPPSPEIRCPGCDRTFAWPGLLEAHKHVCVHLWEQAR